MSDFDEELDEEAAAMAAAMGFSTFGSHKPPAKKRKFNPAIDAFVSGQELEAIDRGGKKGKGSGGNDIPLGKMRTFGNGKKVPLANEEEIDVEDEDEDGGVAVRQPNVGRRQMMLPPVSAPGVEHSNGPFSGDDIISKERLPVRKAAKQRGNEDEINLDEEEEADGPAYIDTSKTPPAEADAPAYIDTSKTSPVEVPELDAEAIEMQARLGAILASIDKAPPPDAVAPYDGGEANLPPRSADIPYQQPLHPGYGGRDRGFSDTASVASSRPSHGGGNKNPNWCIDYYDQSFNENPWKQLEEKKGLTSAGTWIEPSYDQSRRPR